MKLTGVNMGTVYHTGFKTYLLMAVIGYLALCFVDPYSAQQVLIHLHSLVLAFKV